MGGRADKLPVRSYSLHACVGGQIDSERRRRRVMTARKCTVLSDDRLDRPAVGYTVDSTAATCDRIQVFHIVVVTAGCDKTGQDAGDRYKVETFQIERSVFR
jgi:hypothetical protein